MDLASTLLIIAGAFDLLLSSILLLHGSKTRTTVAYAVLAAALALWAGAILVLRLAAAPGNALAALKTSYVAGVAIAASFWYFARFFSGAGVHPAHHLGILGGGLAVSLLAAGSPAFIRSIGRDASGALVLAVGPAHLAFVVYLVGVLTMAFLTLARRYRTANPAERAQLGSVILGTALTALIGTTTNVVLVQAGVARFIALGPIATIIMVAFIAFAIIRHQLLSVRVIAAEVFTLLLLLALGLAVLPSAERAFRPIDGLAAAFALAVSVLLIRSALHEAEMRETLTAANAELRRLDAAKSEFISLAGHQFRTPVTAIREYTSRVVEGALGPIHEGARNSLRQVLAAATQLTRLVDELLNLSRIEAGHLEYAFQPVALEAAAERAAAELAGRAAEHGITLSFWSENTAGLRVHADPEKLHEVILNLLDNAIAYSPPGVVDVQVRPHRRSLRWWLRLSVIDRGIGIRPEDLPRLFGKFARSDEAKTRRPDGLGLGLYLVRKLVEDHGGRVWVESPGPGRGSTFFVELPVI